MGLTQFEAAGRLAAAARATLAGEIGVPPAEIDLDAPLDAPHPQWASRATRDWRGTLDACLKAALGRQYYVYELWSRSGGGSAVEHRTTLREVIDYVLTEMRACAISDRSFADPFEDARWEFAPPVARPTQNRLSPAVFLLSAARAGSTLTRVMLHGNPRLFAAPELFLLMWDSLAARRRDMDAHGYEWFDRGFRRTLVELGITTEAAIDDTLARLETADTPMSDVYRMLVDAAAPAILVDKTPPYALDMRVLRHAEALFSEPRYICLTRHPMAVIESWARMKFHGTLFGRHLGVWDDDPYRYAEKWWSATYRNLTEFADLVPDERALWVAFEDVLGRPEATCARICGFLDIPYDERMTRPYADDRMQDAHGDPNLRVRTELDASRADAWRANPPDMRLSPLTRDLARDLGYHDV
ncbi:sulfotransferase [Candidatus Poribacteria bacterium]|nr:sulfotransferase [Candidatus Poribacteria bacterium]MBT5534046.1 sulfotransferase [Candidatus Poribacteria bacterium]MBT5710202.1 sulfotransferase [Candidatus Poribacteria bacterium]MBT7097280.1 sulfotransferase [Candidatus Poribacteria bacterium]MBT7805505.1 sulfotransferase [Candidatus Poribacteria bacterium]